jgi:hypothetical protein
MSKHEPKTYNKATRTITSTLGVVLSIAAFTHGVFSFLQGNKPTDGFLIQAIGDQHRFWLYGTEEAITIIPNFLFSGLLTILMSIFVGIWSVRHIDKKNGSLVFLLSFIILTLIGGGLAHIVFFVPIWGYSTRICKKLSFWSRILPEPTLVFGKIWAIFLLIASTSFVIALIISVFGLIPGVSDPDHILIICWSFLGLSLFMVQISYITGFASDIYERNH